jgi:outer membrane autotransporter protein
MIHGKRIWRLAALAALIGVGGWTAEAQVLDEARLAAACGDPLIGAAFRAQCAIFDIDAPTRDAAIGGNRLGNIGATGSAVTEARERMRKIREDEDDEAKPSGQSDDWTVGRVGFFVNADGKWLERGNTANEVGRDTIAVGGTLGVDIRITDNFVVGGAVAYSHGFTDFNQNAGRLDTDNVGSMLFASISPTDTLYLDAYIGYEGQIYDGKRNISFIGGGGVPVNATARSGTDGDKLSAGVGGGVDFPLGALTVGPHGQFDFSRTTVNGYTETGGAGFATTFGDQKLESLQGVFGVHLSYALSTEWGVLVPYGRLDFVHEFSSSARNVPASFVQAPGTPFLVATDTETRNFGRGNIGLSAIWPNGWVAFADYENEFGKANSMEHRLTVGFRKEL